MDGVSGKAKAKIKMNIKQSIDARNAWNWPTEFLIATTFWIDDTLPDFAPFVISLTTACQWKSLSG